MKHARPTLYLVICLVVFPMSASRLPAMVGEDWPPVSPEELAMKDIPGNPGAPAVILYRKVITNDRQKFESHYVRIKVLTEGGKKYGDVEIPYYEKRARIEDIRARTVHPDGHETPLTGQIFDKLVVRGKGLKLQAKTFTLPDVQTGTIVEFSYKVVWHHKMPDFLTHPENYSIDFGTAITVPTAHWELQDDLYTRRASYSLLPIPKGQLKWSWRGALNPRPSIAQDGTVLVELENVPGFEKEEYMPPESVARGHMDLYYIVGYALTLGGYWSQQAKQRTEAIEKFMQKHKAVDRAVAEIVSPSDSPEVKLRKLYARAQQIRSLSYEQARTEKEEQAENLKDNENVEDVLKRGYARANEINLFFASLARAAGFEAEVVEVSARDRMFFNASYPNPAQFTAMVVWVRMGSEDFYLDPATRFCPFKILPWEETGANGIRPGKAASADNVLVTTPAPASADAVTRRKASLKLNEDGTVEGDVQVTFTGQEALQQRLQNVLSDAAGRRKGLEEQAKGWLPAGTTVELTNTPDWERTGEPLSAEFRVKIPNFGVSTASRLLLPLAVFQANYKYPFQNAKRVHSVYLQYPFQELDDITLIVPDVYQVESLPALRNKSFPFGKYVIARTAQGNTLNVDRRLVVDNFLIPLESYSALRVFFDSVRAGDEEQIVLKTTGATARK